MTAAEQLQALQEGRADTLSPDEWFQFKNGHYLTNLGNPLCGGRSAEFSASTWPNSPSDPVCSTCDIICHEKYNFRYVSIERIERRALDAGWAEFSAKTMAASPLPPSKCESPVEELLHSALTRLSIPHVLQHDVGRYRLDFAIVDKQLAIEVDGHAYHSSRQQREHDAKRDRFLMAKGWRVVRFTGSEVHRDAMACARQVAALL